MDASTTWSRRSVLVLAATGAGAAMLAGPLGSAASAATTATAAPRAGGTVRPVTGLQRAHWTPLVGKKVAVSGPAGKLNLKVIGVEDLPRAPKGDAGQFAVELRTASGPAPSGLYTVTIPGRGVTTLLLSAVDRGARYRISQIVVNNPAR